MTELIFYSSSFIEISIVQYVPKSAIATRRLKHLRYSLIHILELYRAIVYGCTQHAVLYRIKVVNLIPLLLFAAAAIVVWARVVVAVALDSHIVGRMFVYMVA